MSSPFPGMNPYLEDPDIWEDFHANLATEIQAQLTPSLRPRYVAALMPRVTYDEVVIQEARAIKPDVGVLQVSEYPVKGAVSAIAPAPLVASAAFEVPVRLHSIEIRETQTGLLVTAIEILSPVNKRPGHEAFESYQRKRRDVMRSEAHLLEIDLLRTGSRFPVVTPLPDAPYFIFLSRAGRRSKVEIWPLRIQDPIPMIPVPLREPDPDVPLDLNQAIHTIYDRLAYDLRIDYTRPPPKPDLPAKVGAWLQARLQAMKLP